MDRNQAAVRKGVFQQRGRVLLHSSVQHVHGLPQCRRMRRLPVEFVEPLGRQILDMAAGASPALRMFMISRIRRWLFEAAIVPSIFSSRREYNGWCRGHKLGPWTQRGLLSTDPPVSRGDDQDVYQSP